MNCMERACTWPAVEGETVCVHHKRERDEPRLFLKRTILRPDKTRENWGNSVEEEESLAKS